jgi:folate-dependent phosphoribosylglycinamide formyltransferase PurN
MTRKVRCILGSATGASFFSAFEILRNTGNKDTFIVLADRNCELTNRATSIGLDTTIVPWENKQHFSRSCGEFLKTKHVGNTLMLFSRLVDMDLLQNAPLHNMHPALLPAFPGIGAERMAVDKHVKFIGSTLHKVDNGMDTGEIAAQCVCPLDKNDIATAQEYTYVMRVYLILVWCELTSGETLGDPGFSSCANPALRDKKTAHDYKRWLTANFPKVPFSV